MTLEEMQELLKDSIPGKRYKHSVNVYETALKLAEAHGPFLLCCTIVDARCPARRALPNARS